MAQHDIALAQQTTISASTSETTIVTADANTRNLLVGLHVTTPNTAAALLTLRDSTAGNIVAKYNYPNAASAPSTPLVISFYPPLQQTATNSNWTLTCSANAGSVQVTALYVKEQ